MDNQAIIGLDMAMPAEYQQWTQKSLEMRVRAMKMMPVLKKMGLLALYSLL